MLTAQECIDYCDLTDDVVRVIADRERVPDIVAAELGRSLLATKEGVSLIQRYVRENIEQSVARERTNRVNELQMILERFDTQTAA
jgi:transcriptional regulator